MKKIILGQDGSRVKQTTKKEFNLVQGCDTRIKRKNIDNEVFDFVGFVCGIEKTLIVFPKNFYSEKLIEDIDSESKQSSNDIDLLFNVIQKYLLNQNSSAIKYAGKQVDFESDYPFSSFFSIYNYFHQFGIYKEIISKTNPGYNGKVSWKDTIRKSRKVYSNGNIIHFPLYLKQKKSKQVFISDCMAFAIDYTLDRFPFLFAMPKTNHKIISFDFLENIEYVINYLHSIQNEVFKDINKRLIKDLIQFYSELDGHKRGGDIHVKINYFNLVWEEMIEHYLNSHFVSADNKNNYLLFDINQINSKIKFSKKVFNIDKSNNQFTIEPDHYFIDDNLQYIFDAKYYGNLDHLNYKQYSYHEMLKNNRDENNTISALISPSDIDNSSEIHLTIADEFVPNGKIATTIISQKLNIKEVMESYVKLK